MNPKDNPEMPLLSDECDDLEKELKTLNWAIGKKDAQINELAETLASLQDNFQVLRKLNGEQAQELGILHLEHAEMRSRLRDIESFLDEIADGAPDAGYVAKEASRLLAELRAQR